MVLVRKPASWLAFCCLLAWLPCAPVFAQSGTPVQTHYVKDQPFSGIWLRQTAEGDYVATSEGVKLYRRVDFFVRSTPVAAADDISRILAVTDDLLQRRETARLNDKLPMLDKAIKDFDDLITPYLDTITVSAAHKKTMQVASEFYHAKRNEIAPTLEMMQLVRDSEEFAAAVQRGAKPANLDALLATTSYLRRLRAAAEKAPLVKRDREKAEQALLDLLRGIVRACRAEALDEVERQRAATKARALVSALAASRELLEDLADEQAQFLKDVRESIARYAAGLPAAAAATLSFRQQLTFDERAYQPLAAGVRELTTALEKLPASTFGPGKADLDAALAAAVTASRNLLAESDARLAWLRAFATDYQKAQKLLANREYATARTQLAALLQRQTEGQLADPALAADLAGQMANAEGNLCLTVLRAPERLTPAQLDELVGQGETFLRQYRAQMAQFGLAPAEFEQALDRTRNYRLFRGGLVRVQQAQENDPLAAWRYLAEMDAFLARVQDRIHADALTQWRQLSTRARPALAPRAAAALLPTLKARAKDDAARQELVSLFDYAVASKDLEGAYTLSRDALKLLHDLPGAPLTKAAVDLHLKVANAYASTGQFDRVTEIYQWLVADFPDEMRQTDLADQIAELLHRQGLAFVRDGELAKGIAYYRRICSDYGAFATAHNLYEELLDLELRVAKLPADQPDAPLLKLYDQLCRSYAAAVGTLRPLLATRDQLLERFTNAWDADPEMAVTDATEWYRQYPAFSRATGLMGQVLKATVFRARQYRQTTGAARAAPAAVYQALGLLLHPEYKDLPQAPALREVFVDLRLQRAEHLLAMHRYTDAFQDFRDLQQRFPTLADEHGVAKRMQEHIWRLRLERFRTPLRISSLWDWAAVVVWPVLLLVALGQAWRVGRRERRVLLHLGHAVLVAAAFLGMLAFLLSASVGHGQAVLFAVVVPQALLHSVGLLVVGFFPHIYLPRRCRVERWAEGACRLLGARGVATRLATDAAELAEELPWLQDPVRFQLERACHRSRRDAPGAYAELQRLLAAIQARPATDPTRRAHQLAALLHLGTVADRAGQPAAAREHFLQYLDAEPRDTTVRELLAGILLRQRDYEGAIPHLKVCVAAASGSNDPLWHRLGRAYFETGRYVAAYKCFAEVKQPTRDDLYFTARAYARSHEYDRAVEAYQALLKLNPYDGEGIYGLAAFLASCNEDPKALKLLDMIQPADGERYLLAQALQADLLQRNERADQATAIYQKLLQDHPHFAPARLGLAQICLQDGRLEPAIEHLQDVLEHAPEHPQASLLLASVLPPTDPARVAALLTAATKDPAWRREASRRLGCLHYFAGAFDAALTHFQQADADGEHSPWFLYLYADTLARQNRLPACEDVLLKLLGTRFTDPSWQERAPRALYTLALRLAERQTYRLAVQCLQSARELTTDKALLARVEAQLEELRFRLAAELMARGEYAPALEALAVLQLETASRDRFTICQYYSALCQLLQRQYAEAKITLDALLPQAPGSPRYHYSLLLAELGLGHDDQAGEQLARLQADAALPPHLRVGLSTVQAYMSARFGKLNRAEQQLDKIADLGADFPGREFVAQKVLVARTYYLCLLNDTDRLADLMAGLNEQERGMVAYYHALAALVTRETESAYSILAPYAGLTPANQRLCAYLASLMAQELFLRGDLAGTRKLLEVPDAPPVVQPILHALDVAAAVGGTDLARLESVSAALGVVRKALETTTDRFLLQSLHHNQGCLLLRRASLLEGAASDEDCRAAWREAYAFWQEKVFTTREYWNLEHQRLAPAGQVIRPFTNTELESVNQKFKLDVLLQFARSFFLLYLERGDEAGARRQVDLVELLGQSDGFVKTYLVRLVEDLDALLKRVDRTAPPYDQWGFLIATTRSQADLKRRLETPDEALERQVEAYVQMSTRYASPAELQQIRRSFYTNLLGALHDGIRGSFGPAGDRLDECLKDVPPGVHLEALDGPLRLLREACRNPSAHAQSASGLRKDFERVYQQVRDANISKGSDDAAAAQ